MKASELKLGDYYTLSQRKNAKTYQVAHIEVVTGELWQHCIKNGAAKEGDIFIQGTCFTKYAGQQMLDPNTEVFLKK